MKAKTVNESLNENRVSSRGKKTDDILQFVADAGPEGRGYTEIIRFAYEYSNGSDSYSSENRGYWSGSFKTPSMDARGFGHLMKYLIKNDEGRWILRDDVMSGDEAEFHGNRIDYRDSAYKPELYKGVGRKEKEIESWKEDFIDDDTGEVTKITRNRYK